MALQSCVGSIQASSGYDSQGAAAIAPSALTGRGACYASVFISEALNFLGVLYQSKIRGVQSCLHLEGGPVISNVFSEGFALCLVLLVRANNSSSFHSSASDLRSFGIYRCTHVPIWTCDFLDVLLMASWARPCMCFACSWEG